MFGEPRDQESERNARLSIADNCGDGSATIRCQLAPDHEGLHREQFEREGGMVTITRVTDERRRRDHGCGQWEHAHSDYPHCHQGEEAKTCSAFGKAYYYREEHKRHCVNRPFTCSTCGENGIGAHVCPTRPERLSDEDDLL